MPPLTEEQQWQEYKKRELEQFTPLLTKLGFVLDTQQPHIGGERFLMQALTTASGKKLVLLGRRSSDNARVVIKATRDAQGMDELVRERKNRAFLQKIKFAYQGFFSPEEVLFIKKRSLVVSIQKFIECDRPFLERTLREQFSLALKAFKTQESTHATTYGHERAIRKIFEVLEVKAYLRKYEEFQNIIAAQFPHNTYLRDQLTEGEKLFERNQHTIDQYCGFLTHTDFVPHNFRVVRENIYLFDHSALRFGNKYEGWARFLNFMALYNPALEEALILYVAYNRTAEELLSLKLMRVYRLGEIICYYTKTLSRCSGNLALLNAKRVQFWAALLHAVLHDSALSPEIRATYQRERDALRSHEEKERQIGLH